MNNDYIITKESLNEKDPFGYSLYLKCDIPIWEEFGIGLRELGGMSTNNNFRGVRSIRGQVPNTEIYKEIYVVTHNPKSQALFNFIKEGFTKRYKDNYKRVNISEFKRLDKKVYVIEHEYSEKMRKYGF